LKKLYECLTREGFTHCTAEHSIFTCSDTLGTVVLAVHMDDMPVTVSSSSAMAGVKDTLQKYFDIVDLGPVKWLLRLCIE